MQFLKLHLKKTKARELSNFQTGILQQNLILTPESIVVKSTGSRIKLPRFKLWIYHLQLCDVIAVSEPRRASLLLSV